MHVSKKTFSDIIIAQASPQGVGALALLRLVGSGVLDLVEQCVNLKNKKKCSAQKSYTAHCAEIFDQDGSILDFVIILIMRAPSTFTGLDTVEITCHNNIFIIQSIIDLFLSLGARLALPGEFTKLAMIHGKIDLLQAEAIQELLHANSPVLAKAALSQVAGSLSAKVSQYENELLALLATVSATFEFIEEEQNDFAHIIINKLIALIDELDNCQKLFDRQLHARNGFRVVLLGSVNVGKSSLFNGLLGKSRAIVSDKAGTTRDVIEAGILYKNRFLTLVDTAGIRVTNDEIEQIGVEKALQEAILADLILLVYDGSRQLLPAEQLVYDNILNMHNKKVVVVWNKVDQGIIIENQPKGISCSAVLQYGFDQVYDQIEKRLLQLADQDSPPFIVNQRHMHILHATKEKLLYILRLCQSAYPAYEIIAFELQNVLVTVSELTGKTINEQVMDRVFATFCVGK